MHNYRGPGTRARPVPSCVVWCGVAWQAKTLALGLGDIPGVTVDVHAVETNIVFFDVDPDVIPIEAFIGKLRDDNVIMQVTSARARARSVCVCVCVCVCVRARLSCAVRVPLGLAHS